MHRLDIIRKVFLFICSLSLLLNTSVEASSPKYPFPADFVVNAIKYEWSGSPAIAFNLINNGFLYYDSLEIRLFFDTSGLDSNLISNLAARLDIGVVYRADGYMDSTLSSLRSSVIKTRPQKYSFNSNTGKYVWYYPLKLDNVLLSSGTRVRIDLIWDKRATYPPYEDLMDAAPDYIPGDSDWSWGPKSRSGDYPADFSGIISGQIDDVDTKVLELNPYITVYKSGKLIWGLPPDWKNIYSENFGTIPEPVSDPLPYAQIAVPFSEYEDQLVRDSANLKISRVRVNQAGYRPEDKKYIYYIAEGSESAFKVIDISGKDAGNGTLSSTALIDSSQFKIKASNNALTIAAGDTRYTLNGPVISGTIYEGLLPDLIPGKYRVVVGADTSSPFVVNKLLYNWVGEALLKFFGASRCGDTHSWFHKPCHLLDPITGGWHDAGDHLKEGITQGYTAAVLGLCAAVFHDKDQDVYNEDQSKTTVTDGIPDILYEAKHGADYILQSYEKAGGQVANMITSVGNFGDDHNYWGLPEFQDNMPAVRGGAPREARNEVGANILGDFAADLAFVSKLYRPYDSAYSDKCLVASRNIYEFIKLRPDSITNNSAYSGSNSAYDDIAFAAMALTWATGEKKYLNDLCYDKTIGKMTSPNFWAYEGGWFTYKQPIFCHDASNTDWASTHVYVLWGLYRLILDDKQLCTTLGITDTERLKLIEKTAYHLIFSLSSISDVGDQVINVPDAKMWKPAIVKYKLPWFEMHTQMEWMWNGYQAGNITEMYMYYDVASRLQGIALPNTPASTDWKTGAIKDVLVRQLDYMLGVNQWDISMIYGIGAKNLNHPHYRASNPELKNTQIDYNYRHLTGALASGYSPKSSALYSESAADYMHSEFSIATAANLLVPVFGLSSTEKVTGINGNHVINTLHENNDFKIIQLGAGNGFCIKSEKPFMSVVVYKLSGQIMARYNNPSGSVQTIRFDAQKGLRFSDGLYFVKVNFKNGGVKIKKVSTCFR